MAKKATSKDYQTYSNWQEAQNLSSYGSRGVPNKPVATGGKKTVPEVLDWGKGIPKDYLAYLNKQEMALVQNARKFKGKRSYKGIPAYPDPGDTAAGDTGQGTSSSAGLGNNTSPGNYHSTDSRYGNSTSNSTAGDRTGGGSDSGGGIGNLGGTSSTNSGVGSERASETAGGPTATGTTNADSSAMQSAAESDAATVSISSPALRRDAASGGINSIGIGPENNKINITNPSESSISGAIARSAAKAYSPPAAAGPAVSRGPGSVSGMIPGNNDPIAQERSLQGITNSFNETYNTNYTPDDIGRLAKTVAGEAIGESDFGQAAVANTMVNRILAAQTDPSKFGYMGGADMNKLLGQYDATGMRQGTYANKAYTSSVPGTESFRKGMAAINSATDPMSEFSTTASPQVLNATHYYNPDTVGNIPSWGGPGFERVGAHVFGNDDNAQSVVGAISDAKSMFKEGVDPSSYDTPVSEGGVAIADPTVSMAIQAAKYAYNNPINISIPEQSSFVKALPDSVKVAYLNKMAAEAAKKIPGAIESGLGALKDALGPPTTETAGKAIQDRLVTVDGVTKEVTPEQMRQMDEADRARLAEDLQRVRYTPGADENIRQDYKIGEMQDYPKYVTPEEQAIIAEQEKYNRYGITGIKRTPLAGPALNAGEKIYKLFTGSDIADEATNLKHEYMQSSPEKQAEMRAKYPDMRRFAVSIGQIPPNAGNQSTASSGDNSLDKGGQDTGSMAGILALDAQERMRNKQEADAAAAAAAALAEGDKTPSNDRERYNYGPFAGGRPAKYYQWDLGMRVPKLGDPDYNEYRYYLRQRRVNYA